MKFRINVVCVNDEGTEQLSELMVLSRDDLVMETMGLTLAESKSLLHDLQSYVVERQATGYLEQHRACPQCGNRYASKRAAVAGPFTPHLVGSPCQIRGGIVVGANRLTGRGPLGRRRIG